MENIYEKVLETAGYIQSRIKAQPVLGIILGSGLGPLVDELEELMVIDYKDIPNFPLSTVEGHAGQLVTGWLGGKFVMAMKGRFHYYEGYDPAQIAFPVRVMKKLGINDLLVTNAAGGINQNFKSGALMLISDHISFYAPAALRGRNMGEFGPRFPDMSEAYSKNLRNMARRVAEEEGITVQEGIYVFAQGPMFETPAEIRAFRTMGADAVGMSTVPEVITARHAGMKVLGISCITNMAAGILDQPLNHEEVMATAKTVEKGFTGLVKKLVEKWEV